MATPDIKQLSVTDLERMLVRRSSELSKLERERAKLRKRLTSLEQRIAAVGGAASEGRVRFSVRKGLPRHKNPKSLKVLVVEILRENKKGLNLKQLADKVLKTGYKTSSSNFSNTVYQAVYNSNAVSYDEANGLYRTK
jgi:hypothetical protein